MTYKQLKREIFALKEFKLGIECDLKGDFDDAEKHFKKVQREDDAQFYAQAQFNLGLIYHNKGEFDKAEEHWLNVQLGNDIFAYASAQWKLSLFYKTNNRLDPANNCFNQAKTNFNKVSYSDERFPDYILEQLYVKMIADAKTIDKVEINEDNIDEYRDTLYKRRTCANDVQKKLHISSNSDTNEYEASIAHYTTPMALFNLTKKTHDGTSKLRLNLIDFMNDPAENKILADFLQISGHKNNDAKIFLASFSFNAHSLNQFRLYGNENNIPSQASVLH